MAMRELAAQFLALAEKKRRQARVWLGIALWVRRCCIQATSPKDERTMIRPWRFTIPPSLFEW
jgi:hypothetical protein